MLGVDFGSDAKRALQAFDRSLVIIEYAPDGTVLGANENFYKSSGYRPEDIVGKHHRIFVDHDYGESPEFQDFWAKLRRGEYDEREYKRLAKGGKEVWVRASYHPVTDAAGRVKKIVNILADITAGKLSAIENEGKLDAVLRGRVVAEYSADGTILAVNDNFLKMTGFSREKIIGRHHRIFVNEAYAQSAEYEEFWRRLNRGEHIEEEIKRVVEGGKEVWVEMSYNPILDHDKRVVKVINYITDVTGRVSAVEQIGIGLSRLAEGDLQHRIDDGVHSGARAAAGQFQRFAAGVGTVDCRRQRQYARDPLRRRRDIDRRRRSVAAHRAAGLEPRRDRRRAARRSPRR